MKTTNLVIVIALLLTSMSASASILRFQGVWKNTNNNTKGITKLIIRRKGKNVYVSAYGKCHPKDCAWGTKKAAVYTYSVSASELRNTTALTATYPQGFSKKLITIQKARRKHLLVELFSTMKDSRSNYFKKYLFKKISR